MQVSQVEDKRKPPEVGDLVCWYDMYSDGIVQNAGLGLLMEKEEEHHWGEVRTTRYHVFRMSPNLDFKWFDACDVDLHDPSLF